jgi:hypothetical protein
VTNKPNTTKRIDRTQWYRIDLHLHTPGSSDYQEPGISYLDILHQAELRGLDVIAFTDHNTVAGYRAMHAEIDQLTLLDQLNRATPEERRRLADYKRLLDKILVLPGFEFTATFGFHILGVFSPQTPIRTLEHILLSLNVPPETLDEGTSNVGASSDVLTAYRAINDAGGIVIAAHVNTAHGVAMRGLDFGGQTRIAYTQDPYLHALEVTDLEYTGRSSTTARFFDGRRAEYPRRMRCIQGSDAHRLNRDERVEKNLGIGDRSSQILLEECTFEAMRDVFRSVDFARTRPFRGPTVEVYDTVHLARETGVTTTTVFHPHLNETALTAIATDICGLANGSGGTLYVGVSADPTELPVGIEHVSRAVESIRGAVSRLVSPQLRIGLEALETQRKTVIRVQVPRGEHAPYVLDNCRIYVRPGVQTILAERDQIVALVLQNARSSGVTSTVSNNPPPPERLITPAALQPIQMPDGFANGPLPAAPPAQNTGRQPRPMTDNRRPAQGQRSSTASSSPNNQPSSSTIGGAPPRERMTGNRRSSPQSSRLTTPLPPPPLPDTDLDLPLYDDEPILGGDDLGLDAPALPVNRNTRGNRPPREVAGSGGIPRNGVEIIGTETRKGEQFHIMRDLRNGQIVKNVTRGSARQLWQYAIIERESHVLDMSTIRWNGDVGLVKRYRRGGSVRYDLVMRDKDANQLRTFYGVTDSGLSGAWLPFTGDDVPIEEELP